MALKVSSDGGWLEPKWLWISSVRFDQDIQQIKKNVVNRVCFMVGPTVLAII
jgi:hypothetical protein